jgi:hypothetical protein
MDHLHLVELLMAFERLQRKRRKRRWINHTSTTDLDFAIAV